MTKTEFLLELKARLAGLSQKDIDHSVDFYREMIEDRMEEGEPEEEAVAAVGTPADVAARIFSELPLSKIIRARLASRTGMKTWEMLLLILGSPIWASLLISAFAVVFSVYAALWSVAVALWSADASFLLGGIAGVILGGVFCFTHSPGLGLTVVGSGLLLGGLSILLFAACKNATRGLLRLSGWIFSKIKSCFIRKGATK